jgi:hypothetical protein
LRDCFGFHRYAIKRWDALKYGLDQCGINPEDEWMDSCYVCFNDSTPSEEIALVGVRAINLMNVKLPLNSRNPSHFVAIVDSLDSLQSPAFAMDVLGGILFRDASKIYILPPVQDPREFIDALRMTIDYLSGAINHQLVRRIFGSIESAKEFFLKSFVALIIRDLLRVLEFEGRQSTDVLSEVYATLRQVCEIDITTETTDIAPTINQLVNEWRPQVTDKSLQSEWESVVSALYNRPKPPRGFKIFTPSINTQQTTSSNGKRTAARRMSKRSYKDLLNGDDSDIDEPPSRVGRKKIPQHEEDVVLQIDNWLQCDSCSKWRLVDSDTVAAFEDKTFTCKNLPNKTCDDPSDY